MDMKNIQKERGLSPFELLALASSIALERDYPSRMKQPSILDSTKTSNKNITFNLKIMNSAIQKRGSPSILPPIKRNKLIPPTNHTTWEYGSTSKTNAQHVGHVGPLLNSRGIHNTILEMGGFNTEKLVIQKTLTDTDINKGHNRLSIPVTRVIARDFLTMDERETLKLRDPKTDNVIGMDVPIIEPDGVLRGDVTLKKWDMTTSSTYVLNRTWFKLVNRHNLQTGTAIQLWSFRVNSALHFALEAVPKQH